MSVIFSRACEYAVRGLVEMARHPEQTSWTIPEVAEQSINAGPFFSQDLSITGEGGILNSTKGRQRGFSFARSVDKIFLIEIVQIIDGPTLTHDCALGLPNCNDDNPCPFHVQWKRVRVPLIEALSQESLAHLTTYGRRGP